MNTGAEQVRAALEAWLAGDPSAVLVGEGVGRGAGNAGSTRGLLERFGDERVIDTPIGDRSALGLALGMALGGRAAAVELTGARALLAAAELLAEAGGLASSEFAPALTVRVPVGGEAGPRVDAAVGALLAGLAGVRVVCASTGTAGSLLGGVLGRGVVVVLEPRRALARRAVERRVDPTRLATLRDGGHVTVAAAGDGVDAALAAADALSADGISAEVLDLVALSPVDPALGERVRRTGRLVVAHPGDAELAQAALAHALEGAFVYLESPLGHASPEPHAVADAVRRSVHF